MAIASGEFANGAVFMGIVRTWLLVETDPLDSCDAENE